MVSIVSLWKIPMCQMEWCFFLMKKMLQYECFRDPYWVCCFSFYLLTIILNAYSIQMFSYMQTVHHRMFHINLLLFWKSRFVYLFVWGITSHLRIFHAYGDITITAQGLQTLTYARHSWPLSSEGSLVCYTYSSCNNVAFPYFTFWYLSEKYQNFKNQRRQHYCSTKAD